MAAATSSIARDAWLEKMAGTPTDAAARAAARSASRCASSSTPIGASRTGAGSRRPNSSTDGSRAETSRSIRGTMARRSKARRFARIVSSAPAPPATYANASGDIDDRARSSSCIGSNGTRGRRPMAPPRKISACRSRPVGTPRSSHSPRPSSALSAAAWRESPAERLVRG